MVARVAATSNTSPSGLAQRPHKAHVLQQALGLNNLCVRLAAGVLWFDPACSPAPLPAYSQTMVRPRHRGASCFCHHGARFGIWAAINDFRVLVGSPVQPLSTAITEGHKFTLHSHSTPRADIVGRPFRTDEKHLQFGHLHWGAPTG